MAVAPRAAARSTARSKAGRPAIGRSAWTISVNAPSPRSWRRSRARSSPRSASEPGTLKRLLRRLPRLAAPATPATSRTSQAATIFLRLRMTRRVQASMPGDLIGSARARDTAGAGAVPLRRVHVAVGARALPGQEQGQRRLHLRRRQLRVEALAGPQHRLRRLARV